MDHSAAAVEELQELSRRAAACLPKDWIRPPGAGEATVQFPSGAWCGISRIHNDTGRCTEIMVRVLWPASVTISGAPLQLGRWNAWAELENHDEFANAYDNDPMLAFRVAVLRAVVALASAASADAQAAPEP